MHADKTGRRLLEIFRVYWVMELIQIFPFLKNIFQVVCTEHVIRNKSNKTLGSIFVLFM